MTKPITPMVGADTFVVNSKKEVCLVRRRDNNLWALPGGCQELNETPMECAIREFYEETGLKIKITKLLGVYSSRLYEYKTYPYKDNVFCHILYEGKVVGGQEQTSNETKEIKWFSEDKLSEISDGHEHRIKFGFANLRNPNIPTHFE